MLVGLSWIVVGRGRFALGGEFILRNGGRWWVYIWVMVGGGRFILSSGG